ncbi:MAG: cupin domain-containing protein [Asgard group archaeon]|nr:cupin domain-containing protein [Asgard group archaeon]
MTDKKSSTIDFDTIYKMEEIINYQQGSVVSRQLIKKNTGNITIFAFDKDEGLSEHTAPFDAMVYVIDGEVEVKIADKKHFLNSGEMIVMPANIPHALFAIKQFKMLLIMIKDA